MRANEDDAYGDGSNYEVAVTQVGGMCVYVWDGRRVILRHHLLCSWKHCAAACGKPE